MKRLVSISIVVLNLMTVAICSATVFTVTNTQDSGPGSLREALTNALYYPNGPHGIAFDIPISDPNYSDATRTWTITLNSGLPYINKNNLVIDARTQTYNQGDTNPFGPEIVLDGNNRSVDYAFFIYNGSGNTIKGFCIKDFLYGIQIAGSNAASNMIEGNYIGTDPTASTADSCYIGIEIMNGAHHNIIGGTQTSERNIISGNAHIGVRIVNANYNTVIGNYIGLNRTGSYAIPNYDGMSIEGNSKYNVIGGTTPNERNVISGNYAYGIPVFGAGCSYNKIIGNYVGTDATGMHSVPNTYGLLFDDGASENYVGGSGASARNVFSGNWGYGVFLYNLGTRDNIVKGNYIGVNALGTAALPNANGIVVDGAPMRHIIDSNVISGNLQQGIALHITHTDSTVITRNRIGTDETGTIPIPNGMDGIQISEGPKYTRIGGSPEMANIIAYNGGNGISLLTTTEKFNTIRCNRIFNNALLGIDLYPPGTTANDAGDIDAGPNDLQNFPVIASAKIDTSTNWVYVYGTLDTQNPETATIDIYIADTNAAVYGEGKTWLAAGSPDANGNWSIYLQGAILGQYLTATATSQTGNTSEFSLNVRIDSGFVSETTAYLTSESFSVFPNPATDKICLQTFLPDKSCTVLVYSAEGKLIAQRELLSSSCLFDTSEWKNNTYFFFVKLQNGSTFLAGKAIVMH